jgi:hypothetical protein
VARAWLFIVGREGARSAVSCLLGCSRGQMRREMSASGNGIRITDVPPAEGPVSAAESRRRGAVPFPRSIQEPGSLVISSGTPLTRKARGHTTLRKLKVHR